MSVKPLWNLLALLTLALLISSPSQAQLIVNPIGVIASGGVYPFIFVTGSDGNLWLDYDSGSAWPWFNLGKPSSTSIAGAVGVIASNGVYPYTFVTGTDGNLWVNYDSGSAWAWFNLGKPSSTSIAGAVGVIASNGVYPYTFVTGTDGNLWVNYDSGSAWAWFNLGKPSGTSIAGAVGVIASSGVYPYAFVTGTDGNLWVNYDSGSAWAWFNLGKPSSTSIAGAVGVIASSGVYPYAFVTGTDGNLWVNYDSGSAWAWFNLGKPSSTSIAGAVGVIASKGVYPYIFVTGADGNLWLDYDTGSAWQWLNFGKPSGANIAGAVGVITSDSVYPYAFVTGTDGNLWVNADNGSAWQWLNVEQPEGAPTGVVTTTGTFTPIASPTNSNVKVFFGIRYAAPPEGALRWAPPTAPTPPTPPTPPSGLVAAANPGNFCPQPVGGSYLGDEDCLFLNVWAPANVTPGSKLPVLFWIHGGGFLFGDGSTYDPSTLVQASNIIVVTINYRLGALGWLVEPGLAASTASAFQNVGDAGNYGLMDQQFAMRWVQSNIAAFGGDPTKVTIGGESSGGVSVLAHLTSMTTAAGLFRGAISESGSYAFYGPAQSTITFNAVPTQSAYQTAYGPAFDSQLGCTPPGDAACLRGQTVQNIVAAQTVVFGSFGTSPVSGTKILPMPLPAALSAGSIIKVPVLQGTNANEGTFFEPSIFPPPSGVSASNIAAAGGPANYDLANANSVCASGGVNRVCTYSQEVTAFLGILGLNQGSSFNSGIAADYPLANFPDPYLAADAPTSDEALSQIYADLVFTCNAYDVNTDLSQYVNVFAYEFNDPDAPPYTGDTVLQSPNDVDGFSTGSQHTAELPFLFDEGVTLSSNEQQLATELKAYWGNFVVSGNPNTGISSSNWPAFTGSKQNVQNLVPAPQTPAPFTGFSASHFCSTWQPILTAE